jgi:hypothetical protein
MAVESAVDTVVEEVATNLEEIASATRRINANSVTFFLGGLAVGTAVGFYFGYKWNKEKIKAEVFAESEKEVEKIRELYQQKTIAAEPKPSVEEVMEERGYSTATPPRPLAAPVPVYEPPAPGTSNDERRELQKNDGWDYPEEIQNRSEDRPYVIHQDEFKLGESGYDQTTYTWYAVDEVMVEEGSRDPLSNVDFSVGLDNLKFGHGTDDIDVVFVRNDKLELEMEICRLHQSYEEEVVGLDGNEQA